MNFCGLTISSPVMNAAGPLSKTLDDVQAWSQTKAGLIMVGSITVEPRLGNDEPRWYDGDYFSLNSFGLPNAGLSQYLEWLPQMAAIAHQVDKPLVVSLAGFSLADYIELVVATQPFADMLELNLSCPNAGHEGQLLCFQSDFVNSLLLQLQPLVTVPISLKLSPFSNPVELQQMATLIQSHDLVKAITCCNSFPNAYFSQGNNPVLEAKYGGLGGSALLPIALGQVAQFRSLLKDDVAIIGVGGIQSAEDMQRFIAVGASLIQSASLLVAHGHRAIDRLIVD